MVLRVSDGKVVFTNRCFMEILGRDGAQILGHSWTDFFADTEERRSLMIEFAEKEAVRNREIRLMRPDGEIIWSLVSISEIPIEDEQLLLFAFTDVTERKKTEEALRDSEKRFRALVESAPICIHEIDLEGNLTSMNTAGLAARSGSPGWS